MTAADCPLCPGKVEPGAPMLLGLEVCRRCVLRWRIHALDYFSAIDPSAVAWCIQVHRRKLEHMVSVRVARRLVLAEHLGLEVDVADLELEPRLPWTT